MGEADRLWKNLRSMKNNAAAWKKSRPQNYQSDQEHGILDENAAQSFIENLLLGLVERQVRCKGASFCREIPKRNGPAPEV